MKFVAFLFAFLSLTNDMAVASEVKECEGTRRRRS